LTLAARASSTQKSRLPYGPSVTPPRPLRTMLPVPKSSSLPSMMQNFAWSTFWCES